MNEGKEFIKQYEDTSLRFYIGTELLQLLISSELIKIDYDKKLDEKNETIILPCDIILDKLEEREKSGKYLYLDLPLKLPMIVKPKEFLREELNGSIVERLGGYLLNDIEYTTPLIIKN